MVIVLILRVHFLWVVLHGRSLIYMRRLLLLRSWRWIICMFRVLLFIIVLLLFWVRILFMLWVMVLVVRCMRLRVLLLLQRMFFRRVWLLLLSRVVIPRRSVFVLKIWCYARMVVLVC